MIDVFEIGASLHIHGNGLDFMRAFSGALAGAHGQIDALEKRIGATKGAMRDLFVGAGQVFAGAEILKGITHLAEAGQELNHQQSMLMRNGVSHRDVMKETSDIYKDMLKAVPTASAVDFLRTLGELKTVKGSIAEAREALTQSLKIEGLIGNSTGKSAEGQGYDFWRTVEDKGIIQDKRATDAMLNRMVQGTIATGGKIGGNDWFSYARAARSAWMGDDIEALPLQLMEMQTLTALGAGSARRMFSRMIQGGQKLTKKQIAMFDQVGMLEPGTDVVVDRKLEHSRPDLFIEDLLKHLESHGVRGKDAQEAWALRALNASSAAYFNVARAGITEVDPESGLTRLQKERKNMGDAQPLDKAYSTMMKTDFEANMHALQEQWKSFTEAVGGPAAKAMIPVLQGVTSFVTDMANFADKNQKLTQFGVDAAAAAGGLLVLGGSLRMIRGLVGIAGGGLFGLGRSALSASASALTGSAGQLDASALALKEAAAALGGRGGVPGGPTTGPAAEAEKGLLSRFRAALPAIGTGTAMGAVFLGITEAMLNRDKSKSLVDGGRPDVMPWDNNLGLPGLGETDPAQRFAAPNAYNREARARVRGLTYDAPNTDGNALHRNDEAPAASGSWWHRVFGAAAEPAEKAGKRLADLNDRTGLVLTSFDTLKGGGMALNDNFKGLTTGSAGMKNALDILTATALGAARALAQVAMSGGTGGSGFLNASWGSAGGAGAGGDWGGGGAIGSGFGGGGWSKSGATRPEVADYIRTAFARQGIDPSIAVRVANSEGLNSYIGDHGSSFGAFQLHYGGVAGGGNRVGGLGDRFTRETGLDARDPTTWKAQIDFAARTAKHEGWGAWHGWRGPSRAGMDWHGPMPAVTAPPRKVAPGAPANGPMTSASNEEHHHHVYLDGKEIAKAVTKRQVASLRYPNSTGGPNGRTHYRSPGTLVTDAA